MAVKLDPTTLKQVDGIAHRIKNSKACVIFTGAGMSTESGIPDYRSQGGLWDKFQPVYFDDFMADRNARIQYWEQRIEMEKSLKIAQPNKGHTAIARMVTSGAVTAVITQNIDGLHQASGIDPDKIIELHGNTRMVRCMGCRTLYEYTQAQEQIDRGNLAPECECGGYLKPDTISFGQAMPKEALERAAALSSACDVFIAVGSTLLVQPAASMPEYARASGAFTAIINLGDTPFDARSDLVIRQRAGAVLSAIAGAVCT